jgi:hypothetical protein
VSLLRTHPIFNLPCRECVTSAEYDNCNGRARATNAATRISSTQAELEQDTRCGHWRHLFQHQRI